MPHLLKDTCTMDGSRTLLQPPMPSSTRGKEREVRACCTYLKMSELASRAMRWAKNSLFSTKKVTSESV